MHPLASELLLPPCPPSLARGLNPLICTEQEVIPSAGSAEWVQSCKFHSLYQIFSISSLMSEMTFHRARSPERKNFLHLRLLTAARVDLQEFFHMLMWKTEPSLTPKSRSVICGLVGGRRKNTCICVSMKKQARMTQVISYNGSSSQQENWNSELPGLHRSAQAASSKPWNPTAWMEKTSTVLKN